MAVFIHKRGFRMLIRHCNQDFAPDEVWFLKDFNGFIERFLLFGVCCVCNQTVVVRVQVREQDDKPFVSIDVGKKAEGILNSEKNRLLYSSANLNYVASDWVFGVNIEIKNKQGIITQIRQYASDFFGNKKLLKKIAVSQ